MKLFGKARYSRWRNLERWKFNRTMYRPFAGAPEIRAKVRDRVSLLGLRSGLGSGLRLGLTIIIQVWVN